MRLTASGLARAEACVGSVVLPAFVESTRWSGIGSAVDRFVQAAKQGDRAAALKEAPAELRPYLEALTLERIPAGAEYQVAFALNALTGEVRRIPGRAEGYPDDLGDEWIFGTSDIVGVRPGSVIAWDLKWGSSTDGRDPAGDLQLGFYGACASAVAGVDEAELAFLRAGWDGVLRPDSAVLDAMDLAAMRDRIATIWKRARQAAYARGGGAAADGDRSPAPLALHVGEHCHYCPARRGCDAHLQPTALVLRGDLPALAATEGASLDTIREAVRALTPEQRGRAYQVCGEIEDRAKAIRAALRQDARQGPIPLGDGKELREVQWGTRQASPAAKAREAALEEELRAAGEVKTIKVPQVRIMAAKR
jgi:hypothetical protein